MSTVLNGKKLVTARDLERMPRSDHFELIEGELVPMTPPGGFHAEVSHRVEVLVGAFILEHDLGTGFAEAGFLIGASPDTVLAPDFAFVSRQRMPQRAPDSYVPIVPDLVLETRSPTDRPTDIKRKVEMWLTHGVQIVWDLDLKQERLTAYSGDGRIEVFGIDDILTAGDLLPELSIPMRKLFPIR